MAPKEKKTKAQIALAAASAARKGGKKWTSGAKKDKANIAVFWDQSTIKKVPDVAKAKNITISGVRDKLGITGGLCKQAIRMLEEQGQIVPIAKTSKFWLYTKVEDSAPAAEKK